MAQGSRKGLIWGNVGAGLLTLLVFPPIGVVLLLVGAVLFFTLTDRGRERLYEQNLLDTQYRRQQSDIDLAPAREAWEAEHSALWERFENDEMDYDAFDQALDELEARYPK